MLPKSSNRESNPSYFIERPALNQLRHPVSSCVSYTDCVTVIVTVTGIAGRVLSPSGSYETTGIIPSKQRVERKERSRLKKVLFSGKKDGQPGDGECLRRVIAELIRCVAYLHGATAHRGNLYAWYVPLYSCGAIEMSWKPCVLALGCIRGVSLQCDVRRAASLAIRELPPIYPIRCSYAKSTVKEHSLSPMF